MNYDDWVVGDRLGLSMPVGAAALRAGGPAFLTDAFRAFGALSADNRVVGVTRCEEWLGGGVGSKLLLSVEYERPSPDLPTDLFVKFSRNFEDAARDNPRFQMEQEVRLATLAHAPGFPITTPTCLFADFHRESGTGVLITRRIAYGTGAIEPHYPKCLDHEMPEPLAHYRVLIGAVARLAGTHKAGSLPASVGEQFPFDLAKAMASDRLNYTPQQIRNRVARLSDFSAAFPRLALQEVAEPTFLARFEADALQFLKHQDSIKRFLHSDPDFIALCHWNANIDNAWFWRDANGDLHCGLMDWGNVGQMNLAMTIWGCLSGVEDFIWRDHLDELLDLFIRQYAAAGGPALDPAELNVHFDLYVAMMGLAYLMDAPPRIRAEIPDLADIESPYDPRFTASETARVQLLMMRNFLNLWRRRGFDEAIARAMNEAVL